MTDAELEAERAALLAEEQALEAEHARLHQRPDDRLGHQAHRERLKAHTARVRAFQDLIRARTASQPQTVPERSPTCPVCRSEAVVPSGEGPRVYRCLGCGTEWLVASPLPTSATNKLRADLATQTMTRPDRPRDVDEQRCPSCEASLVQQLSVVGGQVWLVCGRCGLRWSIRERRVESDSEYRGFERRRPLFG